MKQLQIENARIGYRNFRGAEGPYNRQGDRNFVVFLDEAFAADLEKDGWNIKWPKPNPAIDPDEDQRQPYLPVEVSFRHQPPKVILIAGENVNMMKEDQLSTLDYAEIESVDVVINPYLWEVNGKTGVKAYLKAIYVTLETDLFTDKYGI